MSKSEAAVQQDIRLAAAKYGTPLLRNNNGACYDDTGRLIRYGLSHDSADLNRKFKSSDLIGINPVIITPAHVGMTIGQFMAVEVKREDWKPSEADERYVAQRNFGDWVLKFGGCFTFATSVKDIWTG